MERRSLAVLAVAAVLLAAGCGADGGQGSSGRTASNGPSGKTVSTATKTTGSPTLAESAQKKQSPPVPSVTHPVQPQPSPSGSPWPKTVQVPGPNNPATLIGAMVPLAQIVNRTQWQMGNTDPVIPDGFGGSATQTWIFQGCTVSLEILGIASPQTAADLVHRYQMTGDWSMELNSDLQTDVAWIRFGGPDCFFNPDAVQGDMHQSAAYNFGVFQTWIGLLSKDILAYTGLGSGTGGYVDEAVGAFTRTVQYGPAQQGVLYWVQGKGESSSFDLMVMYTPSSGPQYMLVAWTQKADPYIRTLLPLLEPEQP